MATDKYLIQLEVQVRNDKQLQALTKQLERTSKTLTTTQKAAKTTGRATRNFGNTAQNAGYQIQDMVVQIQGGVDPMRAMSQQLPQMLVGFGAWGAAIGVVTALLPTLVTLLGDSNEEMDDTAEASEKAAKEVERVAKAFDDMEKAVRDIDLSNIAEAYQQATEQQESLIASTLEYRSLLAEIAIGESLQQFNMPIDVGFESGVEAYRIGRQRMDEFAESVGVAADQMIVLEHSFRQALDPATSTADNLSSLVVKLQELYVAGGSRNEQLKQTIELLRTAAQATAELESANEQLLQEVVPTATRMQTNREDAASSQSGVSPDVQARIEANDYAQMLEEVAQKEFELQQAADARRAALQEGWKEQSQAMQLFERSFETMLDGVLMGTQSLSDGFKDMAKVIIAQMLKLAAYKGIASLFAGSASGSVGASIFEAFSADGNAFQGGKVIPFAKGGVVSGPTIFPMANGAGLMGEAGPEAVMPLARNSRGELGVKGGGVNVTVNNMAPGVAVNTRETEEGLTLDVVMDGIAGAVRRGGNSVADAMEQSYALSRGRGVY